MKNKKGFTLVELLAVIAILAILVIIVLPRVVNLFEESQVKLFRNESESFYKAVEGEILSESLKDRTKKLTKNYSSLGLPGYSLIDMDGRTLTYCVKVVQNNITTFKVSDGVYQIVITGDDDIDSGEVDKAVDAAISAKTLEITPENPLFTNCD